MRTLSLKQSSDCREIGVNAGARTVATPDGAKELKMKLRFVITKYELNVLKRALKTYPKNKDITHCLLEIIEAQCESQKEKENNND